MSQQNYLCRKEKNDRTTVEEDNWPIRDGNWHRTIKTSGEDGKSEKEDAWSPFRCCTPDFLSVGRLIVSAIAKREKTKKTGG